MTISDLSQELEQDNLPVVFRGDFSSGNINYYEAGNPKQITAALNNGGHLGFLHFVRLGRALSSMHSEDLAEMLNDLPNNLQNMKAAIPGITAAGEVSHCEIILCEPMEIDYIDATDTHHGVTNVFCLTIRN